LAVLQVREVKLRRERVTLSPLYYTVLHVPGKAPVPAQIASLPTVTSTASRTVAMTTMASATTRAITTATAGAAATPLATVASVATGANTKAVEAEAMTNTNVGYIRLTSFSGNAAVEMRHAITDLTSRGATSFILDLRNNPGGLVKASIDIASLFMDGSPPVFNIASRDNAAVQTIEYREDSGKALTKAPLTVLVNENSASASEILAGALADNDRAVIIGDHNTYGKGRIQSVFELQDGSALLVTVAKYVTPLGHEIDTKGLKPDKTCEVPPTVTMSAQAIAAAAEGAGAAVVEAVSGLPLGIQSAAALERELAKDGCVLAAETVLFATI
jgi:C-terminal processing protease CtpA/Prc